MPCATIHVSAAKAPAANHALSMSSSPSGASTRTTPAAIKCSKAVTITRITATFQRRIPPNSARKPRQLCVRSCASSQANPAGLNNLTPLS